MSKGEQQQLNEDGVMERSPYEKGLCLSNSVQAVFFLFLASFSGVFSPAFPP